MRTWGVSLVVIVAATSSVRAEAPPRKPSNPAALEHYTKGARLFGNASFAEAIEEFKASALVEPSPATDFNLGVAYRLLGEGTSDVATKRERFNKSIWHYERFIKTSPATPARALEAQKLVDKMRDDIAAMPAPAVTPPKTEPERVEPAPQPTTLPPESSSRDVVAWTMVGSGVAALGVAGGLFWSASSLRDDAKASPDQKEQESLRDRADTRSLVGKTLGVVGGALVVGGVIKFLLRDDPASHATAVKAVTPSLGFGIARDGAFVFGRF